MAVLNKLTLATAYPKRDMTPAGRFRRRLLEALDLQIEIAAADDAGIAFSRSRQRWVKNETGGKELTAVPLRIRRWWWKDETGKTYLSLRCGARLLEIAPGKKAIEVGLASDLTEKLSILREAVCAGELDACGAVRETPRPSVKKRQAESPAPRAAAAKA